MAKTTGELTADLRVLKQQLKHAKETIQSLEEDKKNQREQIMNLQSALMAKEAPAAYTDLQYDKEQANIPPEVKEEIKKRQEEALFLSKYEDLVQKDLFEDGEDFLNQMTEWQKRQYSDQELDDSLAEASLDKLSQSTPIHENDES